MKFSELQLHPKLQANLDRIQFLDCTPIQEEAIPLLRKGKDLSGLAQTGTGKTAAFLVPLLDRLLKALPSEEPLPESETVPFADWKRKHFILVLVPTRELAEQVQENAKEFLVNTGLSSVSVYGGTTYEKQVKSLKEGTEVVIATPGRLIDLYKEHVVDLGLVRAVVFDEADRMFDMGFKDDMKFVLKRIPRERQFLVFSATLNFEVLNTAYEYGAEPVEINISRDQAKAENVKDSILHVGHEDKPKTLLSLIRKFEPRQAIIFSNFKHNVERIAKFLSDNKVPAMGISSLLTQGQRNRVMAQFKAENDRNILVATDVAARGLDIRGVDLVINFDLPDDAENYVHRIGRTGRAGATGQAFSMVGDRDVDALQRIEEYLHHKLEVIWLEDTDLVTEFSPFPREERRPYPNRASGGGGDRGGRPGRGPRSEGSRSDGPRGEGPRREGGPGRGGPRRDGPPRSEGSRSAGPRGPRNDGPRAAGPRSEGSRSEGSRPAGGPGRERAAGPTGEGRPSGGRESHRDRQRGRHRDDPQGASAQGPRGEGRRDGPRPGGPQARGQDGRSRPGTQRQDSPRGQSRRGPRPTGGSHRPSAGRSGSSSMSASGGIGQKVSGFFKKLFGK